LNDPNDDDDSKRSPHSLAEYVPPTKNAPELRDESSCGQSSLAAWRQQMCSWAFSAVDTYSLDREYVSIAMSHLDRYVASELLLAEAEDFSREDFQLVSMTALYTAVKSFGELRQKIPIEALVDMSRGCFAKDDIMEMECDLLAALKWYMNPPTALAFCRLLYHFFPYNKEAWSTVVHLTELAVCDAFFISCSPIHIAIAALQLAGMEHGFHEWTIKECCNEIESECDIVVQREEVDRIHLRMKLLITR